MTAKSRFLFLMLLLCQFALAQQDFIVQLREVSVTDRYLKDFSRTQEVTVLNDSVIQKNGASLTSLLQFNSGIYFKENGLGMVSSAAFRGTTAQQTAVLWNGIYINSVFTGQTDFNTIPTAGFDNISIRSGGGSTIYGSGAIGGSIHLNNKIVFENRFTNEATLAYGSFNTFGAFFKQDFANDRFALQWSVSRNSSSNDYEYLGTDRRNENGQFYNTTLNAALGYKINKYHMIKYFSQWYQGQRHFSLYVSTENKTKYQDFNVRNLLQWDWTKNRWTSNLKLAWLNEQYKYFSNIDNNHYTFGDVSTLLAKYALSYQPNNKMTFHVIGEVNQNQGKASSMMNSKRTISSASLLLNHQLHKTLGYEFGLRKESTSSYQSPLLFWLGSHYEPFSFYQIKANISRNFRMPTFNDLYWEDSGNPDLKAEQSLQFELGNVFTFKKWSFSGTFFHSKIDDMIRWLPNSGGLFSPENTAKVSIRGFESAMNWNYLVGRSKFKLSGTYTYTQSEDWTTGHQLIYVPFHKMTAALAYSFGKFAADYQYLYNGKIFTQSDNDPTQTVPWFVVSNLGLAYHSGIKSQYHLGLKILNLWNEKYQTIENRPMPGRNFNVYLTFKF
ncbi:TonB-dependent receptor [Flavobacterium sp. CYK-4]|uniref:TonB-dependent receptor plug domain-containing protein n=1 Tax=Flavobacterium lotistagni TaxID=2709660 RepID=UPI001408FB58|nr:TonB-dependent receptor [Flavobacterium lotistagni]NHM07254.1 TonB-dependent receptor [Flavobacterium lotistagni]